MTGTPPPLRAAVIGCGVISKEHLEHLAASPRADLVGVCDLSPATAEWTAQEYATTPFTDHRAMLADTRPDVVHVLTPPKSHVPLTRDALDAGAHVVVEKPIAATAAEAARLYDQAEACGRHIIENQNYRYNDGVLDLRHLVAAGRLGHVTEVEVRVQQRLAETKFADPFVPNPVGHLPGGAIRDYLPHMVGLVLELAGDEPATDVRAVWRSEVDDEVLGLDALDATFGVGDVIGRVHFSSRSQPEGFMVTVRGTEGTAGVDLWQPHRLAQLRRGATALAPLVNQASNGAALLRSAVRGFRDKVMQHLPYHGVPRLLDAYYQALQHGTAPPLGRDEVLRTLEAVDSISRLAEPT